MRIKDIDILSYGKLNNLKLHFSNGLNIIYGNNESGKSTIRSFIFNIIFGGTVPGTNRAIYTKEYESYKPWQGNNYEGGIVFQYKNEEYHFYRNFNKGNESLSIRDIKTGEESKEVFKVDISKKVEKIDENFFGLNESTIRDLFLITHDSEMENKLPIDLKERIMNYFSSNSEKISIDNVFNNIDELTYGKEIRNKISTLKKEILEIGSRIKYSPLKLDYDKNLKDLEVLNNSINEINSKIEIIEKNIENFSSNSVLDTNSSSEDYQNYLVEKGILINKIEELEDINTKDSINIFKSTTTNILTLATATLSLIYMGIHRNIFGIIGLLPVFIYTFYCLIDRNRKNNIQDRLKELYAKLDIVLNKLENEKPVFNSTRLNGNIKELYEEEKNYRKELEKITLKRDRYLNDIKIADKGIEEEKILKERLNTLKEELEELYFKRDMGKKSKEIINKISKEDFSLVSPNLIEDCSNFINIISEGKYSKLYVGNDGNLSLFDEEIRQIVDYKDLSKGAINQVYLAYRLGLIVNSGVNFPILIDDGLSLYDMDRNHSTIKLLNKLSTEYQILLFTSNSRDIENIDRNEVNLLYI